MDLYKNECMKLREDSKLHRQVILGLVLFIFFINIPAFIFMLDMNKNNIQKNKMLANKNNALSSSVIQLSEDNKKLKQQFKKISGEATQKIIDKLNSMFYIDDIPLTLNQQEYIHRICSKYDINYKLFIGLIDLESSFDIEAVGINRNKKGVITSVDKSLCQVNSKNEKWIEQNLGRELDLMNFYDNIDAGAWIFNYYKENSIYHTLTNYNKGREGASKYYNEHGTYKSYYAILVLERMSKYE